MRKFRGASRVFEATCIPLLTPLKRAFFLWFDGLFGAVKGPQDSHFVEHDDRER